MTDTPPDPTAATSERETLAKIVHDTAVEENIAHVLTDPGVLADAILAAGYTRTAPDAVTISRQDAEELLWWYESDDDDHSQKAHLAEGGQGVVDRVRLALGDQEQDGGVD